MPTTFTLTLLTYLLNVLTSILITCNSVTHLSDTLKKPIQG